MMTNMPMGHPFRRPAVWGELPRPLLLAAVCVWIALPLVQKHQTKEQTRGEQEAVSLTGEH
jgi:hypothetical protein